VFNGLKELDIPVEPLTTEAGYFLLADISKCRGIIPKKYLETHDYEDTKENPVAKN
jgi:hypothetical protein